MIRTREKDFRYATKFPISQLQPLTETSYFHTLCISSFQKGRAQRTGNGNGNNSSTSLVSHHTKTSKNKVAVHQSYESRCHYPVHELPRCPINASNSTLFVVRTGGSFWRSECISAFVWRLKERRKVVSGIRSVLTCKYLRVRGMKKPYVI